MKVQTKTMLEQKILPIKIEHFRAIIIKRQSPKFLFNWFPGRFFNAPSAASRPVSWGKPFWNFQLEWCIIKWGTNFNRPLFPSVRLSFRSSVCPPVHRALYLKNCTSDQNFWYACVKLCFWGAVRGVKGQNIAQIGK